VVLASPGWARRDGSHERPLLGLWDFFLAARLIAFAPSFASGDLVSSVFCQVLIWKNGGTESRGPRGLENVSVLDVTPEKLSFDKPVLQFHFRPQRALIRIAANLRRALPWRFSWRGGIIPLILGLGDFEHVAVTVVIEMQREAIIVGNEGDIKIPALIVRRQLFP
jgi:hypothetical protein